jgi:hypothetical protein
MSSVQEPERWISADDELAVDLRAGLRLARGEGPSATEHDRMWNALAAKLPLAAAGDIAGAPAQGGGDLAPAAVKAVGRPGWLWIAGTGVVAAAIGFAAAVVTRPSVVGPPAARIARVAPVATQAVASQVSPSARASAPTAESAGREAASSISPAKTEPVSARSSADTESRVSSRGQPNARSRVVPERKRADGDLDPAPRVTVPPPTATSGDLPGELDLLARARRVVASDPARALQLTAEHGRRYQDGVLVQEREVLAIEALQRLGHREMAAARARRFAERYPDSAHRVRLSAELESQ